MIVWKQEVAPFLLVAGRAALEPPGGALALSLLSSAALLLELWVFAISILMSSAGVLF